MRASVKTGLCGLFAGLMAGLAGCGESGFDQQARNAVEKAGFTDVTVNLSPSSVVIQKCAPLDTLAYEFTGKAADGKIVQGHVCINLRMPDGAALKF